MNGSENNKEAVINEAMYTEEELQKKIQSRLLKASQEREALRRENAQLQQQVQAQQAAQPNPEPENPESIGLPNEGVAQTDNSGGNQNTPQMQEQVFNALSQYGQQQQQNQMQEAQAQQRNQALQKLQEIEGGDPEFSKLRNQETDITIEEVQDILANHDTVTAKRILEDIMRKPSERAFFKAALYSPQTDKNINSYQKWLAGKVGEASIKASDLPEVPDHSGETVENPSTDLDHIEDMVRHY